MVITDDDFNKILSLIEVIKTRGENLPETLSFLSEKLKIATKVTPKDIPDEVVSMNSFVMINWMNTGIIQTINLVYPEYEDKVKWKVSVFSSLGAALLGRRQGNEIVYRSRKRDFRVKIMGVVFQPESSVNDNDKKKNILEKLN